MASHNKKPVECSAASNVSRLDFDEKSQNSEFSLAPTSLNRYNRPIIMEVRARHCAMAAVLEGVR